MDPRDDEVPQYTVSEEDIEWELGRFYVRGNQERGVTIQDCALAAYSNVPDGMEPGLENNAYYDPPNLTWPFAAYICKVEVDAETGVWDVLKFVAVDDCGVSGGVWGLKNGYALMCGGSVEDVAKQLGTAPWYQLYMPTNWPDTEKMVKRAEDAGCPVLAWTIDLLAGSNTETGQRFARQDNRLTHGVHRR